MDIQFHDISNPEINFKKILLKVKPTGKKWNYTLSNKILVLK